MNILTASMLLTVFGLSACSDLEQRPSELSDIVVSAGLDFPVVFYADDYYIYRRYCDNKEDQPSRSCSQKPANPNNSLPLLRAIPKEDFLAMVNPDTEVPEKFRGPEGGARLAKEIKVSEDFLLDPELSAEERQSASELLADLQTYREALKIADYLSTELLSTDISETLAVSDKYKNLNAPFEKTGNHIMVFDPNQSRWWRFLGERYLGEIKGLRVDGIKRPSCAEAYGGRYPTKNDWETLAKTPEALEQVRLLAGHWVKKTMLPDGAHHFVYTGIAFHFDAGQGRIEGIQGNPEGPAYCIVEAKRGSIGKN